MGRHLIQTKGVDKLNYLRNRLSEAQGHFKNLFPKDLSPEESMTVRNAERHTNYLNLQLDLGIPGPNDRKYSIHFCYGEILGAINNTLKKRANFRKQPSDQRKIATFCEHLGNNDESVVAFLRAERNLRRMNERSPCVTEKFQQAYALACQPNVVTPAGTS
jgi:hypothetical protein